MTPASEHGPERLRRCGPNDPSVPSDAGVSRPSRQRPGEVPTADTPDDALPRCVRCEYLLVGLPGDRCPECGAPIDWAEVERRIELRRGLPLDRARGWWCVPAGVLTFFAVLFRPRWTARRISAATSIWPATWFAVTCMVVGIGLNTLLGLDGPGGDWRGAVAWFTATWFHNELQSLLFLIMDFRPRDWLRQWSTWRKLSFYTTAFVVLDAVAGPPGMTGYFNGDANFPWLLSPSTWKLGTWPGLVNLSLGELLRGVAYYWWMAVLLIALAVRLRRKWALLIILAAMPGVTIAACHVHAEIAIALDKF